MTDPNRDAAGILEKIAAEVKLLQETHKVLELNPQLLEWAAGFLEKVAAKKINRHLKCYLKALREAA